MSTLIFFLAPLAALVMLGMPLVPVYRGITTGQAAKNTIVFNLCAFFGLMLLMIILPISDMNIFAAGTEAAASASANVSVGAGMGYLAAALVTGLSCVGAGIAVAAAAPAAIGSVSEDPKSFGKAMIFVVLGEGVAIYGLLISILIINKL